MCKFIHGMDSEEISPTGILIPLHFLCDSIPSAYNVADDYRKSISIYEFAAGINCSHYSWNDFAVFRKELLQETMVSRFTFVFHDPGMAHFYRKTALSVSITLREPCWFSIESVQFSGLSSRRIPRIAGNDSGGRKGMQRSELPYCCGCGRNSGSSLFCRGLG